MSEQEPEHAGRVALVTGGSLGIGRGAARTLARRGAAVVVHGLDAESAKATSDEIVAAGGRAVPAHGPIDDPDTAHRAVAAALEHFGRLDALVTSAGIQRYGDVLATSLETWEEVLAVNVTGVFLAIRAALPALRASGSGAVVIVASVQGLATQNNVAAYTASKGALHALTRGVAVDEAAHNVRVNSVSPGSVDTPMLRASARMFSAGTEDAVEETLRGWGRSHALGRVASIDEVGEVIAFLTGPRSSFVTGTNVNVDGGLLARLAVPLS